MHSEFFNAPAVPAAPAGLDAHGVPAAPGIPGIPGAAAGPGTPASGMTAAPSYLGAASGHGSHAGTSLPPHAPASTGSTRPDGMAGQADVTGAGQTEQYSARQDAERQIEQRLLQHEAERREQWQGQVSQWRQEVAQDPHLGGDNMAASVARAQLALDRFDQGKHIGRLLEDSGYGNHPDVLRFFNRVADALMEDSLVRGEPGGGMPPLEERMYAGWSSRK